MCTKKLKFFINASNNNSGGGVVLLNDFIGATKFFPNSDFIIYVDQIMKAVNQTFQNFMLS